MACRLWLSLAVVAIVAGAVNVFGQSAPEGKYTPLGDTSSTNEEALAQMTMAFAALAGNQLAGARANGTGVPEMNKQVDEQMSALVQNWADAAKSTFGEGLLRVGQDGKMNINLGPLLSAVTKEGGVGGEPGATTLGLDLSKLLQEPQVVALADTVNANYQAAVDNFKNNVRAGADLLLNEGRTPGMRVADRLQQLEQIFNSATNNGEACGSYLFNPGGAPQNQQWVGPTFTLTQTTGNCALVADIRGQGNVDWTQAVARLACLGPSTQYGLTPLQYRGVGREPESLTCPECKYVYRFGPEVEIVLYGGDNKDPVVFDSEKDFYTAAVLNKTFDFNLKELKAVLISLQKNIDSGAVRLSDLLRVKAGLGSDPAKQSVVAKMLGALKQGLSSGQFLSSVEQAAAEQAATLRQKFEEKRKQWESGIEGSWTQPGGAFDTGAYFSSLKDKLMSGAAINRSPA